MKMSKLDDVKNLSLYKSWKFKIYEVKTMRRDVNIQIMIILSHFSQ